MFKAVPSRISLPEMEANILGYWKEKDVFHRTETERVDAPLFMLFEGPPTANGSPGIHHVLARVFKDVICRHRTMKGYRCLRKGGWDTHGLPVELEIEKELGFNSKREIEEYGIERFNQQCKESVFRYVKEWEVMTDRIGYWVDMEHPYVTLENDYIETGWWILKQLWDRDLLYQGMRGTPHCPRCETSLSSHEVALGYKENTPDPSVFVKFALILPLTPLANGEVQGERTSEVLTYMLAWTTTPWTLPGNTALAISENEEYSLVQLEGSQGPERLILATKLLGSALRDDYQVVLTIKGSDLVGLKYQPLYDPFDFQVEHDRMGRFVEEQLITGLVQASSDLGESGLSSDEANAGGNSWRVYAAEFVSMEDGTGVVHIAPAFGDEDLSLARKKGLTFVQPVDLQGRITGAYPFSGKFVKDADGDIMDDLQRRDLLYHREIYRHTYPFCWRCDTPVLYYAKPSWYIRTTAVKDRLVGGNQTINWYPEYIRDGRFGEWLDNNVDWAISRERYWGTPIPIWRCEQCGNQECLGGVAELAEKAVPECRKQVNGLDLHRPYVDDIRLQCSTQGCAGSMRRIPEVIDAWFDSGAMPFAQWHFPFDNPTLAEDGRFPADYICEAVDQTRGWFYSLHALSTLLNNQPSYKNVICLGLVLDGRGQKMSKRLGNVVEPLAVLDAHGADALRWYLFTASHPGEPRRFSDKLVNETLRRVILTLWNVYSFFTNYATIDEFHPNQVPQDWKPENELDRWILSELNVLVSQVDDYLESYNPTDAGRRIQEFIDGLSNWYVRRSRRRFWKSENDNDKLSAYATLYDCLVTVTKLMAPLAPFVSEEMYQNLVRSVLVPGISEDHPDSVHLASFPVADESLVDHPLMDATRLAMRFSSMGRSARSKAGLKVRQPLASMVVRTRTPEEADLLQMVQPQILEELNIKTVEVGSPESVGFWNLNVSLNFDSAGPKFGKDCDAVNNALRVIDPREIISAFPVPAWVNLDIEGADITEAHLVWDDLKVIISAPQNFESIQDGLYAVALDTDLTSELQEEGLARELSHRIQGLRRDERFELTDRIVTYYQGPEQVSRVMQNHADYISLETLSDQLVSGAPEDGEWSPAQRVEGMEFRLAVRRV